MNLESATASLLMRTEQEPKQPSRPRFTADNHTAWLRLNTQTHGRVRHWQPEIEVILRDTTLTMEGKQKKLQTLVQRIMKDVAPLVTDPLNEVKGAMARLNRLMFDPITTKPKGDPMVTFLREQELRGRIQKGEANKAYLTALSQDDFETVRAILDAPGAPWITDDIKQRGQEEFAKRTNPAAFAQRESLEYFQDHVESLVEQVRTWFLALGASAESVDAVLGD